MSSDASSERSRSQPLQILFTCTVCTEVRDGGGGVMFSPRGGVLYECSMVHYFSLSVENEQAGVGRDGRTHITRPNPQARTVSRKKSFSLFS